jgi:hypothetical protein
LLIAKFKKIPKFYFFGLYFRCGKRRWYVRRATCQRDPRAVAGRWDGAKLETYERWIPMKLVYALLVGIAVALGGSDATASELAVQGGTSTGGGQSWISGQAGGLTAMSVTGAWNDRLVIISGLGGREIDCSIGELSTLPDWMIWPLVRNSSTKLRDGQTRVMLSVPCTPWYWNHGSARLRRGNAVIDSDPIYLWAY